MATSSVIYNYFDKKSSEAFGGAWAQIFNRTLHQPLELSQVQPNLDYFNLDLNDKGSTANMYKGQIVVVTNDNNANNTLTNSKFSPFDDKTGRTGPYLIYGYTCSSNSINGTYYADRILTYTEQQAHYVRKYDLGAYYSGVGEWWQLTRSTYENDVKLANIYRDSEKTFSDEQAASFSYGEIFNDYISNSAFGSYSHAEGYHTLALAYASHAEGISTTASGNYSHAEGSATTTSGNYSHAEGSATTASGGVSHAEGANTTASGSSAHAEGSATIASGTASHTEGYNTTASGNYSHAEGYNTTAIGADSHTEGHQTNTTAGTTGAHAEGYWTTASNTGAHAEGYGSSSTNKNTASGQGSHAEGRITLASNEASHAEGKYTTASGEASHTEGLGTSTKNTTASGKASHAEGYQTLASKDYSHAEGNNTEATGVSSHSEGQSTHATNTNAHAEGLNTTASGIQSHAEGGSTTATGTNSHAEGGGTTASGNYSHTEGLGTTASGTNSHAEGESTTATGNSSHAGGYYSNANKINSIAHGNNVIANCDNEAAFGKYNGNGNSTYTDRIFEIGIGTSTTARKNAFEITAGGVTNITGATNIGGKTTITSGGLEVTGDTTLNNNLTVKGTTGITGDTTLGSTLNVAGATTLNSTLNTKGNVDFDSNLNVDGNLTVKGTSTINMPFSNSGTGNVSINNSSAGLLTNVNIDNNGKLTYTATSLLASGSGNFLTSYNIDNQGHFKSTFGSFANTHSNTNKTYSTGTNIVAANSQVLTYAVIGADGHLYTYYGARPVLSVTNNSDNQAVKSISVSDHSITVNRVDLSVTSGTANSKVTGGTTNITLNGTTTYQFITGITQDAKGQISYAFAGINTTHSGSLNTSTANAQTIGTTSSTTASFVTAGSLSSSGVLTGSTGTISHATSGVTTGKYGESASKTCGLAGKFNVPYITINDCGHITSASNSEITLPSLSNTGTGNVVTSVTHANGVITVTKGETFVKKSELNNLDVSSGNYKTEINIPIMTGSSASKNDTIHVITGITQTDGKISYEYSGLYITPTLINSPSITSGKFLTNITSEDDEDNVFTMVRGNIDIIFDDSIVGNAITDLSVNSDGDIVYKKENTFATKTQLDSLTNKVDRKVINDSTINIYLSNTSTNGTSSSGSFTTNQSTNGSIHLNNVARTNSKNTFSNDQTATAWYVSSDINYKEIIDDCKITIDEISKLPIFDYIWKLDEEKKLHTGSSAQAVEEILPNLVTEDNRGIKNLDYAALGTIAGILACREICKLRDKINKLDKIIENKL